MKLYQMTPEELEKFFMERAEAMYRLADQAETDFHRDIRLAAARTWAEAAEIVSQTEIA